LFTFTIFPKDLPDSTNTVIGNGRSIEEDSNSRNTGLKTDTDGQLKNEKVFNIMSGEGKENNSDNIQIQEKSHDRHYALKKNSCRNTVK
jgi:hypothetical protein